MSELLKEIEAYWSTRTEGYSEVNEKELFGSQKEAWLRVLLREFPEMDRGALRILDIGTGPGFFPMILAERGYYVDAVDYTEAMLEKAKENAEKFIGEKKKYIHFARMDAQKLEYRDGTFDVIISRNLTWNLPEPKKAYAEWLRVLKPGGVLLNFDANWYGYLYDDAQRAAYEKDRKNVAQESLDDHYLCTDIDRMEEIARQVPLSAAHRPAWDEKVLKGLGAAVSTDENIWDSVWSKEEKLNYGSTPMFLVRAVKQDEEDYVLGDFKVKKGESKSGFLKLGGGEFSLPVTIIRGTKPGRTVLVTAGIHPGEYVGIQALTELSGELDAQKIAGTVILVKAVMRDVFERRGGSVSVEQEGNLNRYFNGEREENTLSRLAYGMTEELLSRADFYIDLHGGDDYEELTPYVYYAGKAAPEVVRISRLMAQQVDVPYMVQSDVELGGAYNYAAHIGIPAVLLERGGMGRWDAEEVRSMKRDVRSILRCLGIYDGHKSHRKYYPLCVADVQYQSASCGGLWYPLKKPGDLFVSGDILGYVRDYEGKELERSVAYSDGVILFQTGSLQVLEGGSMIAYGQIRYEQDDRKERIASYWSRRSEDFLKQRRQELHSALAGRWMEEIRRYFPTNKEKIRVLDVGCGTGFFSILLAKEGCQVTGIDLTADMIEGAKKLAAEEGADCDFQVMDAEHLAFQEAEFDMVISRNLTWTLPEADCAYGEWMRVLRPGGVLLNFDANYGACDFADTHGLPENHAHNRLGDGLMQECEEIKRQLPISSYSRPGWDVETLSNIGAARLSVDLSLSERVYRERDDFYNPTPMFGICVWKH